MNSPNLQQLPSRDPELGPMIRRLFLPEEGRQWAAIDFSQQEPRIMTHYAKVFSDFRKETMPGLDAFVKEYQDNPKADFHSMVAQMAGIDRKRGKTISLALLYGMGIKKLAVELGISDEDAKQLTADYHEKVPFVKMLTKGVQKDSKIRALPAAFAPSKDASVALICGNPPRLKCIRRCLKKKQSRPTDQRPGSKGVYL